MSILKRIKALWNFTPANAGEMEVGMTDTTTATPPAANGGITEAQVQKIVGDAVAKAVGPIGDVLKGLADGQKALTDGLAKVATPLKPEDVAKLVADSIGKAQTEKATADAATAKKAAVRKAVIDAKLKGVPESLINLPDTDDEKALGDAADKLRKDILAMPGVKLPDVGGVSNDGGASTTTTTTATPKYTPANSNLSAAGAAAANALKLPG